MRRAASCWLSAAVLVGTVFLGAMACEPPPSGDLAGAKASDLPAFSPAEAAVFDDTIAAGVFGADLQETEPAKDPKLAERVARADLVIPVKVSTVTSDTGGDVQGYQLVVVPSGQALRGPSVTKPLTLDVSSQGPAYTLVRGADATLVGKSLILFVKRYNDNGAAVMHWRLEADTDEVRKAIAQAGALQELGS